jgi:hypothetical protein
MSLTRKHDTVEAIFWGIVLAPVWVGLAATWWRALVAAVRMFHQ